HGVLVGRVGTELVQLLAQSRKLVGQAADGRGVGAAVVVDHDDCFAVLVGSDVVDRFPGHAAGQGAIAHQGYGVAVIVIHQLVGAGNSINPRQRGGSMGGLNNIVF